MADLAGSEKRRDENTQKPSPKASKSKKTLTETPEKLRIDGKMQCCAV